MGVLMAFGHATAGAQYVAETSISYPLRLTSAPTVIQVPFNGTDPHCAGTSASPTAAPGYLCIYIRQDSNVWQVIAGNDFYPQESGSLNFGSTTFGVLLSAESAAAGDVKIMGAWAVTAP
jgi:hypothetical protein